MSAGYQNFIICIEMLFAAISLWFAFPYKIYVNPVRTKAMDKGVSMQSISNNLCETINPRDIVNDAVHNFSPQYRQYIQQVAVLCYTMTYSNLTIVYLFALNFCCFFLLLLLFKI